MKICDLQDLGSAFLVNVPNTKTKVSRKFTITDNFYEICKKYKSRSTQVTNDSLFSRLFLNFQNGKCIAQRIGINKFNKMGNSTGAGWGPPVALSYHTQFYGAIICFLVQGIDF